MASPTTLSLLLRLLLPARLVSGVSAQANTQALMSLAGIRSPRDVLLTAWQNDTFRPCHYVAADRNRRCLVRARVCVGWACLGRSKGGSRQQQLN